MLYEPLATVEGAQSALFCMWPVKKLYIMGKRAHVFLTAAKLRPKHFHFLLIY